MYLFNEKITLLKSKLEIEDWNMNILKGVA